MTSLARVTYRAALPSKLEFISPRHFRLFHKTSIQLDNDHEDFYRYTSGRWLWNEDQRLRERYKRFDVPGLKQIAVEVSGAQACTGVTKLAEGNSNKVFQLSMDNGNSVIARIPMPNLGPASKIIASEVATMDFARNVLGVPVPKVLPWSSTTSNAANSEYILMEPARGTSLHETWVDMRLPEKAELVRDLVAIQQKLLAVSFSSHGNLYPASDAFPGCVGLGISGELTDRAKIYARENFVMGPVVDQTFWDGKDKSVDCGPWTTAGQYLEAVARKELSRCPSEKATLWHWDLRTPNISVEGSKITSIIDWQEVWAGPFMLQQKRPQLIDYHGELQLQLPDHYETIEDKQEKRQVKNQVEKSVLKRVYEHATEKQNPDLHSLYHMPHIRTRAETITFSLQIWEGDSIPLRECLIRLERHWQDLGTGVRCPVSFTAEELRAHWESSEEWNETADFWSSLEGYVSPDGYTALEYYEEARNMLSEMRKEGLATLQGEEVAKFDTKTKWAA